MSISLAFSKVSANFEITFSIARIQIDLDASGKIPEGFLGGTTANLGSYDQCLSLRSPAGFQGKYCMLHLRPSLPPLPTNLKEYPIFRTLPELRNISNPSSRLREAVLLKRSEKGQNSDWILHVKMRDRTQSISFSISWPSNQPHSSLILLIPSS
ncbi:hypothetical protein LAZ67_20001653 [Cordylochernes scorpioides]|uniref:Nose resistant-to-fluoxetine protein N-terminal domain-containing protein n=1 Tax=Cordylochernes scorpioides TaxID=51811 RepID=A0ABY6LK61_9ARAC|nr:hypothetical protein LAZ67_20001653 [Cordylochernes scorpioides]